MQVDTITTPSFVRRPSNVDDAIVMLEAMVYLEDKRNVFKAQDSLTKLGPDNQILKFSVSCDVVGEPDLLYSEEVYSSAKDLGIPMPVDHLLANDFNSLVMIGVSGCGKTRACIDYCREKWGIYFDCTADKDFDSMVSSLVGKSPKLKTNASQEVFELLSTRFMKDLLSARLIVLRVLRNKSPEFTKFDWFCTQRSRRTRELFKDIFEKICTLNDDISRSLFGTLTKANLGDETFSRDGCIIYDEAQHMLKLLPGSFRSTKDGCQRILPNGSFEHERSYFSFLARFTIMSDIRTILCGTQMRIKNIELINSGGGEKKSEFTLFTNFTYLTPTFIAQLAYKWINFDFNSNPHLLGQLTYFLQGRARLFSRFVHRLIKNSDIETTLNAYIRDMTTDYDQGKDDSAFYYFWKQRLGDTIQPLAS